jgi:hypothetical protein
MPLLPRTRGSRGHAAGALHSRIVENSIAAAKMAKTITRFGMLLMMTSNVARGKGERAV